MKGRKAAARRTGRGQGPAAAAPGVRRERVDLDGLRTFMAGIAGRHPDRSGVLFLCIGTDRSTGDAYGPLVGALLVRHGFPQVEGTLDDPCDANRLAAGRAMPDGVTVIAVDACLGKPESVGAYLVAEGPLTPAEAVGGTFGSYGSYSIAGVVGEAGPKPYAAIQSASLRLVMEMARVTAEAAAYAWPAPEDGGNPVTERTEPI